MIHATLPQPKPRKIQIAAWIAAVMIVFQLLLQLFTYEDFASSLASVVSYNNQQLVTITAAGIVIAELLALPYLIGMVISKLMRVMSALFAIGVALFWLFLSLTSSHASSSAVFGATVHVGGAVLPVIWSILLISCVAIDVIYVQRTPAEPAS
jgi:hypothetical protein